MTKADSATLQAFLDRMSGAQGAGSRDSQNLKDYRLVREIGRGGMAVVWEAEQVSLGRRVAIKILAPSESRAAESVARFDREARAGGRLQHPGIVQTYATGEVDGLSYIVQELVPGDTLERRLVQLREEGELPPGYGSSVVKFFVQLASALEHAHQNGVIHRDVKPANILITAEGRPRLADFGLAKLGCEQELAPDTAAHLDDEAQLADTAPGIELSRAGQVMGTAYYMSPEQARGRFAEVDRRTDVFSLGAMLYECLTLERPFGGETTGEVLDKIRRERPRHPRTLRPEVPEELAAIVLKCLEKRPDERYASMRELADDLRRFRDDRPIRARATTWLRYFELWLRRNPGVPTTALGVVLTLAAVMIWSGLRSDPANPDPTDPDPGAGRLEGADFDTVLARHRSQAPAHGWQVFASDERHFVIEARPRKELVIAAFSTHLDDLYQLYLNDWPHWRAHDVAIVRVTDSAEDLLRFAPSLEGGGPCAFEEARRELVIDGSRGLTRMQSEPELRRAAFRQFLFVHHGALELPAWIDVGFGALYAYAGRAGPEHLAAASSEIRSAGGALPLSELLRAEHAQAAGFEAMAFSFAYLLADRASVSERRVAALYVEELGRGFRQALDELGASQDLPAPVGPADLPSDVRRALRREAYEASWGGVDLRALERRWLASLQP